MFFVELIILFVLLVALLLAFSWLYSVQHPEQQNTSPSFQQSVTEVYRQYRGDYEKFAGFVWKCLSQSKCRYSLDIPENSAGIFCVEVADRISITSNGFLFQYEAPLLLQGGLSNIRSCRTTDNGQNADFVEVLENNLPGYLDAGYYFTGPIYVLSISCNRIRIEIHGVDRIPPEQGGYMPW